MAVRKMELILVQTAVLLLMVMVHGVKGADATTEQAAYVGQDVVLGCPLTELYTISSPKWQTQNGTVILTSTGSKNVEYADRVSFYTDNISLVIKNITLSDAGSYSCLVDINGVIREGINTLHTRIRPQPPVISHRQSDGSVTGTEGQSLTLTCTSRGGYPAPTVAWYRGSTQSTFLTSSNSGPLEGDGYTVTATYTFSPTSSVDGSIYKCQTAYIFPTLEVLDYVTATLRLNLHPITTVTISPTGVVTEGPTDVTLQCTAHSKPAPTIKWYHNGNTLQGGQPSTGPAHNTYIAIYKIISVSRQDAGEYKCIATNTVSQPTGDTSNTAVVTLVVWYPPDVTATAQLNNGQLVATCSPSGVPDSYHYSNWFHLWSDGTPISHTPMAHTQILSLTPLTYQDSGIYKCWAGNGVGLNGAMSDDYKKEGSTSVITIESLPIVIGPAEQKVPIQLHKPSTVNVTYYSNVAGSTVSCHRVIDNITQTKSVGVVTTETSPIQLPVYESMVSEQGTSATVTLTLSDKAELGSYVVKITNTVGMAVVNLLAVPEGPPETPFDPRVEAVYTTSVNISWELGYHGAPGQIFIIQYSKDGETWTDGATLDTGNSTSRDRHYVIVDSLSPGTLYSLRIHAYNKHGRSRDTDMINVTTCALGPPETPFDPRVEAVYTTSVNISWELGYYGAPGQIFIIQYSTDGETWTDGATLDTGNSTSWDRHYVIVDSLSPGTLYSLRIHAYNQHGRSRDTDMINVTTSTIGADIRTSSSAVGPAVGGSAAALIVIALVVGLVLLHRKGYSIMRPCTKKSKIYRDHTYENEVEKNETRHEMSQARADSTTQDEGQAAALPYDSLTTTRVTTSTMYDELNITGAGLVGDTTRDGSVAGPYETLEPRQGENAPFYEELKPRDSQEVKKKRESSGDEGLQLLKREVAQANERRLKLEQDNERLRAELEKTNKEVAQLKNTDDRVIVYENLKIK